MHISSTLVVCIGNICRSPLAERLFRRDLPAMRLSSAGLAAVVGAGADPGAAAAAAEIGIDLSGHVARQMTAEIGAAHDLILVMDLVQKRRLTAQFPQLSGKVMLLTQWSGAAPVPDPYGKGDEIHRRTCAMIAAACAAWAARPEMRL